MTYAHKMTYKLVFNRKKQLNSKGEALLQVEVYQQGKRCYFTTHIYLKPGQWNAKKQLVKRHPNAQALNEWLQSFLSRLEENELELWRCRQTPTPHLLKASMQKGNEHNCFLSFFKSELNIANCAESTLHNHMTTYRLLHEYHAQLTFNDIDYDFLCRFEKFLIDKPLQINTIAKHMRHLRRYVNLAFFKGYLTGQSPFTKYRIRNQESRRNHLTSDEIEKLEKWQAPQEESRLALIRDAFLFCCYTGLRYSDFITLSIRHLQQMQHDTWLIKRSVKTRHDIRLPIRLLFDGKAWTLWKKYEHKLPSFTSLPDNSNTNKLLVKLCNCVGIKKHISFHTARHTFATLLLYKGAELTTVQKLLGHSSVKTTEIYAHMLDETILRDLQRCDKAKH